MLLQVVAEAYTKQPPAARPRPVRRKPTVESKAPEAIPTALLTPKSKQAQVNTLSSAHACSLAC